MRWRVAGIALALLIGVMAARLSPAQDPGAVIPGGGIRFLLAVGDPVVGPNRSFGLGLFNQDPTNPEEGVSVIHRVADDGSLFMTDYGGVSLLRFRMGGARTASSSSSSADAPEILLDSSRSDPVDGVALARIIKVTTNRHGVSGIMALRADNTFGIYRLHQGVLTRVGFFPRDLDHLDVAIDDAGEIAYIAADGSGTPALFQTRVGGPPVEIVRLGQQIAGGEISFISDLTANGAGDLAFLVAFLDERGSWRTAVLCKRGSALEVVARQGDTVRIGRGFDATGRLEWMRTPKIGPEGTVVFQGGASNGEFVNFYAQGPGRPFQPLLPLAEWASDEYVSDFAIDVRGTVAVQTVRHSAQSYDRLIYLVAPSGKTALIFDGQPNLEPAGGLTFDINGNLFFLARVPGLPRDRYGQHPVRLFQYRLGTDPPSAAVREIRPSVPGRAGLISITQQPVLSADDVTFGALFGGSGRFAVPTAGLFQVPLGSPSAERTTLVAAEADTIPGAERVGIPQDLHYTNDGSLVVDVLLPGGGTAAITIRSDATTAAGVRTQAIRAASIVPLIATGQPLGQPDRKLLSFLGPFVPLGTDQQLVTARYAQGDEIGEGLFAISRRQAVAAVADTIRGGPNTRYTSFSEPSGRILDVPSVSPEGNVLFLAREDRGDLFSSRTVFQWLRASGTAVRMLSEYDPLRLLPSDPPDGTPYRPERWVAGPAGAAYVQASPQGGGPHLFRCALRSGGQSVQVEPLVVPSATGVIGPSPARLTELTEFTIDHAGEIYVIGQTATRAGLFRLDPIRKALEPIVMKGDPLPRFSDGRELRGAVFEGGDQGFSFSRDTPRGSLLFRAMASSREWEYPRRGLFRRNAQGALETLIVEDVGVTGAREVAFSTLSDEMERQTVNGTTAFALQNDDGHWMILRSRPVRDAMGRLVLDSRGQPRWETKVVARDGQPLGDGRRLVALNAVPLLSRQRLEGRAGPIFTLNDAGDVAFFASDGQRWGVYEFTDRS